MKSLITLRKLAPATAFALALLLGPTAGWSTRVPSGLVSGAITSSPSSTEIEVDHRTFHIKPRSAAQNAAVSLSVGQRVHLILNGPASDAKSQVVSISVHAGSEPVQSE
jgi:uncharacterized transporter YbjL